MFGESSVVPSNGMRASCSWTTFCARKSTRRAFLVVVVLMVAVLVWTVVFSNWNVCRSDLDDDVDALNADAAAGSSTGSSRRSAKICLSPETDSGLRVNMSIDSDNDLRR